QPAQCALLDQASRPAASHGQGLDVVMELVDLLAEVVDRVDALLAVHSATDGPARIERVERPLDVELAPMAVARVGKQSPEAHAAAEHVAVAIAEPPLIPVDLALVTDLECLARAEQIVLGETDAPFGLAAFVVQLQIELERPRVAHAHIDLDAVRGGVVA